MIILDPALAGPSVNLRLSWPSTPKQFHNGSQFQTSGGAMSLMPRG